MITGTLSCRIPFIINRRKKLTKCVFLYKSLPSKKNLTGVDNRETLRRQLGSVKTIIEIIVFIRDSCLIVVLTHFINKNLDYRMTKKARKVFTVDPTTFLALYRRFA